MRHMSDYHNTKMTTKTYRITLHDGLKRSGKPRRVFLSCEGGSTAPGFRRPDSTTEAMQVLVDMKTFTAVQIFVNH